MRIYQIINTEATLNNEQSIFAVDKNVITIVNEAVGKDIYAIHQLNKKRSALENFEHVKSLKFYNRVGNIYDSSKFTPILSVQDSEETCFILKLWSNDFVYQPAPATRNLQTDLNLLQAKWRFVNTFNAYISIDKLYSYLLVNGLGVSDINYYLFA